MTPKSNVAILPAIFLRKYAENLSWQYGLVQTKENYIWLITDNLKDGCHGWACILFHIYTVIYEIIHKRKIFC